MIPISEPFPEALEAAVEYVGLALEREYWDDVSDWIERSFAVAERLRRVPRNPFDE